jgi:CheY-like chemotaxis protein
VQICATASQDSRQAPDSPTPSAIGTAPRRATILVVEDEAEIRALVQESLLDAGYAVIAAADGAEAMIQFETRSDIDLIFTDIVMPGIDGFKVADMARLRRPRVKILYTTAFTGRIHEYLGVMHGPVLPKPYRPTGCVSAVSLVLALEQQSLFHGDAR